jgi:alpha-galactosidase
MPHLPASTSRAGLVALLTLLVSASHVVAQTPPSFRVAGFDVQVIGDLKGFALDGKVETIREGLEILHLQLTRPQAEVPPTFTLKWAVPSHDVAGHWMTGRDLTKSVRPDWSGGRLQRSMFAREAPVSTLFSSRDRNVLTFAVSDALNTIASGSGVREEDGLIYNEVTFFTERHERLTRYTADVRIDRRDIPYGTALEEVSMWWARQPGYEPATVPEFARLPMYSTWYNYHQNVDAAVLLKEVAVAKSLGFESIIVDDGWQTKDSGRGYAFTGDWEPERMPDMKGFVDRSHKLGVKVLLWYAVPFVGKNSKVAARFKEKSLRFDERLGAYVLDPRYPDVRAHVIETYARAIRDWGIDGVKLDFIERFAADEKTVLEATDGRDFASVNDATDRMMTDVIAALKQVRPDVMVEFRQPYIGPLIRKYGNMFRASDCPNAYVTNRVRTIDLRHLSGTTAVHSDMIMWHYGEPVEAAALQFLNIMFSVPQVSVRLQDVPREHIEMITFYTAYWKANRAVLLDGDIEAAQPAANYPLVRARTRDKQIVGVYADMVVDAGGATTIDILNAKPSGRVVVSSDRDLGPYRYDVKDCRGRVVKSGVVRLDRGVVSLDVPASGLLALQAIAGSARR